MYGTPAAPVAVPQTLTDTLPAPNRYTLQPFTFQQDHHQQQQRTNLSLPTIPELTMNLDRSTSPPTSNEHNDYGMSPPRAQQSPDEGPSSKGRALSNSKRAEQNRRAQRAFRERRDAHVKHLESQAALVKETLAEAEVATKRWEECRALIEQLRYENTLLRAALDDAGIETESIPITQVPHLPNGPTTTMTTGSPVAITGTTTNNGLREGGGGGGGGTEQHLNGGIELHPVLQRNVDVVGPHLPKKRRRRDEANAGVEAQA